MGDSSLSLWSEDSFLSIGSAASFGSAMSAGSFGSLLSSGSRGAILGERAAPEAYWLGAGALAAAAAALVWTARRDR